MPTYLWKGKDPNGIEKPVKVNAVTTQEARQNLESQGFTDLTLVKDDLMAEISEKSEVISKMSADEQIKSLSHGPTTLTRYAMKVVRDVLSLTALCGLLIWWRWSRNDTTGAIEFGVILAIVIAVIAVIRLNSLLFAQLTDAQEWRRSKQMLRLLELMKLIGRLTKTGLKPHDDARYRSLAWVWEGHFKKGVAEWKAEEKAIKPWSFLSHLSRLHEEAGDLDQAFELREKGIQSNPNIGAFWLDLAYKYLEHGRNLSRAKEALAQAEALDLPEIAEPFLIRNRGLLAMREGRFEEAEKLLEQALDFWRANTKQHFRLTNIMITKAFLCQVRARLGKTKQARQDFAEAKKWLIATRNKLLLDACEAALN